MRSVAILIVAISGCGAPDPVTDVADSGSMPLKRCALSSSRYHVQFDPISGTCDPQSSEGWITTDQDGHPVFPPNCNDVSAYEQCTTFVNEYCSTWVWNEQLSGRLAWSPSGMNASGVLSFVSFARQDGALSCSSLYQVTYTYEYTFASD